MRGSVLEINVLAGDATGIELERQWLVLEMRQDDRRDGGGVLDGLALDEPDGRERLLVGVGDHGL